MRPIPLNLLKSNKGKEKEHTVAIVKDNGSVGRKSRVVGIIKFD